MRIALVDSGLGVLPAAARLRRLLPGADLVLSMDPDGMPWGPRTPEDIATRALACARATASHEPDVLVFACNTASVHALTVVRVEFEPDIPVVGTVPAIKPAASAGGPVAIWATAATTGSPYQRDLIRQFASGVRVTEIACPGLADAIEAADDVVIEQLVTEAAARTPSDVQAVVLGCTQYELAADCIRSALPDVALYGSASAVAAQALRRAGWNSPVPDASNPDGVACLEHGATNAADPDSSAADRRTGEPLASGVLTVVLSGQPGDLPAAALRYAEG